MIKNKKILITGAKGQLGQEFNFLLKKQNDVMAFDSGEMDISNKESVASKIKLFKPELIINCAAYTEVEKAESEAEKAYASNAFGSYYLALAARKNNAILIHISTDYVFDGTKVNGFIENDTPKPLNIYGLSKLAGEQLISVVDSKYYIFRTSALYGKFQGGMKDNFIDKIITKARAGEKLRVVDDQFTIPTLAEDLAKKIIEIIEKKIPYGIYHLTNSGSCSWHEYAKKILDLAKIKTDVLPVKTDLRITKIKRPSSSILINKKISGYTGLLPDWQKALERYVLQKYGK